MTSNLFDLAIIQDILKWFFVIGGIFYLLYSFIVVRQIQNMRQTLITSISGLVYGLGLLNLGLAILLLAWYLLLL